MTDAADGLRILAEPRPGGDLTKCAIERAAKRCGLSYWRAFDIWYRKARRVEHNELAAIADAVEYKNKMEARNELSELRVRLARLESRLAQTDEDFHRPTLDFMGRSTGRSR